MGFCYGYDDIIYVFGLCQCIVYILLGNRMFTFDYRDVDFYLPQLLTMYIYMHDVAEAVHPYLIHRCARGFQLCYDSSIIAYCNNNANDITRQDWLVICYLGPCNFGPFFYI